MAPPNASLLDRVAQRWNNAAGVSPKQLEDPFPDNLPRGSSPFAAYFQQSSRGRRPQTSLFRSQPMKLPSFGGGSARMRPATFMKSPFSDYRTRSAMMPTLWGGDTSSADFYANRYNSSWGQPQPIAGPTGGGDPSKAQGVSGVARWDDLLTRVAKESGVPKEVLAAIMGIESGGNNLSANPEGATGLMQVVPKWWQSTANQYGGDLMDPYTNVRTAAEILKMGYKQYGNSWDNAAAFFFGGGGAFNSDGTYADEDDMYGTTISNYVAAFRNNVSYFQQQWGNAPTGQRVFPVQGYSGPLELHWGEGTGAIDLFAPEGTAVLAMTGGTVQAGWSEIGGYWAILTGDDGLTYYYAHMQEPAYNGKVKAGQAIGKVGQTGNAAGTGAHLHLGIGSHISEGAGPYGGAGDANVIDLLNGSYRY